MRRNPAIGSAASLAFIIAALCLVGCAWIAAPPEPTGTLVVNLPASIGGAARSIVPDFVSEIDSITVTLSATGQDPRSLASSTSGSVTFSGLAATTWTISLSAIKGGAVIGSGSGNVALASGSIASVVIPIVFSGFDSGTGSFALGLSWPSAAGVDYVAWSIDGGTLAPAVISTNSATGLLSANLSKTLGAGMHTLLVSFKAGGAAGSTAGRFVESVNIWAGLTSGSWMDGSGRLESSMSFFASDFLDANARLGGLSVQDGSTSGPTLAVGFSSATTGYDFFAIPSSRSIVFTPTESVAGQYISYSWNGGSPVGLASGVASARLDFDPGPSIYDNTLSITVRAPDGGTTTTYRLTWHASAVTVDVSTATNYQALTFADYAPAVRQGQIIVLETDNPTLSSVGSGWTWYVDGVKQAETSQYLRLNSATTSTYSVGDHFISVLLGYEGVSYAGTLILSVGSK